MIGAANQTRQWRPAAYLAALVGVAGMTGLLAAAEGLRHLANVSMLYLLVVIAVAVLGGRGPAVLAAVASFAAFDWCFVTPYHRFTVSDPAEWLALLLFLLTAVVVGELTALLRSRAAEARQREREAAALAEASWSVASQLDREHALSEVLQRAKEVSDAAEAAIRQVSDPPPEPGWTAVPLGAEERLGYLALRMPPGTRLSAAQQRAVNSLALHAGVVIERDRLMHVEAQTQALHEADQLKTALLSMISHDFRSPLAAIKASAGSLLAPGEPLPLEVQADLLRGIIVATDRLNRIVENVLSLSRLESGVWRPRIELTPTEEVVASALEPLSPEHNARVSVTIEPSLVEVPVDHVQMAEVLYNLLENALRYSPPRSPVELRAWRGYGQIVFEVADRGPGLPLGWETHLFEPFWRGPGLGESARPGVGLGLAVCRGLVQAQGGTISARRRQGGGTAFRVELPRERSS